MGSYSWEVENRLLSLDMGCRLKMFFLREMMVNTTFTSALDVQLLKQCCELFQVALPEGSKNPSVVVPVHNVLQSGHGKLTREMTRLMASFAHRASIGFQYIGQRPLFNSLFIYGAGTENSAGVDDPAETTNNNSAGVDDPAETTKYVGVGNTSKCQGIIGSRETDARKIHISVKANSEFNSMRVIAEEKMLYEAYRSSYVKNEAYEIHDLQSENPLELEMIPSVLKPNFDLFKEQRTASGEVLTSQFPPADKGRVSLPSGY
ncbi:hypothetical protein Tco_1484226 [Tanacetum coccineum]